MREGKLERVLCSRCIAALKVYYKVVETGRREKVDCSNCGRRGYGARCIVEKEKKSDGRPECH